MPTSFDLTNRYPHLYLRSKDGGVELYDSSEESQKAQIKTNNFRGTAYLKSAIVKSYNGYAMYSIVLEAQTVDWLDSELLKRGRKYHFEFGWSNDRQEREIEVADVTINLVLDYGGVEITLTAYDVVTPFHPVMPCNTDTWITGLNGIKANPTMRQVFSVMRNVFANLADTTFKGETYDFKELEFRRLVDGGDAPIVSVLRAILSENHKRLVFNPDRKECRLESLEIVDRSKAPRKTYIWGSNTSEIESMDINFIVTHSKVESVEKYIDDKGKEQKEIVEDEAPLEADPIRISSPIAGEKAIDYTKRYLPDAWFGSMNVIGDANIRLFDNLKIDNVGILSNTYVITEVTHKIAHDGFFTELKVAAEKED